MFKRPHHQLVYKILRAMDADFLIDAKCYFGGGTAISLLLGEYRESVDIDFLCADQAGYRKLRVSIFDRGLGDIFPGGIQTIRDVRTDRDGIRTVLLMDDVPVKFEIVREARIHLAGEDMPNIPVCCLSKNDLFAEKLLANADRFGDKSAMSRDVIDLMVMEFHWGEIPEPAWKKAAEAYGDAAFIALKKAKNYLRMNTEYLDDCLAKMGVEELVKNQLRDAIRLFQADISE